MILHYCGGCRTCIHKKEQSKIGQLRPECRRLFGRITYRLEPSAVLTTLLPQGRCEHSLKCEALANQAPATPNTKRYNPTQAADLKTCLRCLIYALTA